MKKVVSILMIAVMMIMMVTPVFAVDMGGAINEVEGKIKYDGNADISTKIGNIIGFLQWAGAIGGVLIITIFGIKYMMGSLEEKAEYKKTMIPFVVGAIVLILAPQIAKLIFNIMS